MSAGRDTLDKWLVGPVVANTEIDLSDGGAVAIVASGPLLVRVHARAVTFDIAVSAVHSDAAEWCDMSIVGASGDCEFDR